VDPIAFTRALVDIDSTTGREAEAGRWLSRQLREAGFTVVEQEVDATRFNILALAGPPTVVFSTHVDCVPPFVPARIEGDRLYGRGACDAKGILAAQVAAADRLRREGETRVGLLFVVGEERGSDGAKAANDAADQGVSEAARGCRYLVDGEPTDSRLGLATRGMLRVKLHASGRAAHSAFPELGASAIDTLIDALMFRTVADGATIRQALELIERRVRIEHVLEVPPVRLTTVPGFDTAVFPFTTDIPLLDRWGTPLLFGPGSIHVAHTAEEYVSIAELHAAVDHYITIARHLLNTM